MSDFHFLGANEVEKVTCVPYVHIKWFCRTFGEKLEDFEEVSSYHNQWCEWHCFGAPIFFQRKRLVKLVLTFSFVSVHIFRGRHVQNLAERHHSLKWRHLVTLHTNFSLYFVILKTEYNYVPSFQGMLNILK